MQRIIIRVGFTKKTAEKFQEEVNLLLEDDYKVVHMEAVRMGFRILYSAILEKRLAGADPSESPFEGVSIPAFRGGFDAD
jgi:hypothetical protein